MHPPNGTHQVTSQSLKAKNTHTQRHRCAKKMDKKCQQKEENQNQEETSVKLSNFSQVCLAVQISKLRQSEANLNPIPQACISRNI